VGALEPHFGMNPEPDLLDHIVTLAHPRNNSISNYGDVTLGWFRSCCSPSLNLASMVKTMRAIYKRNHTWPLDHTVKQLKDVRDNTLSKTCIFMVRMGCP